MEKLVTRSIVLTLLLAGVALVAAPLCSPPEEVCDNEIDDDNDGLIDCDDVEDCLDVIAEVCDDGIDNDCDGDIDCADSDCLDAIVETCDDGIDNDCDGMTDCEDPDCLNVIVEDCSDEVDNDCDGKTDCEDENCFGSGPSKVVINEFIYNPFGLETTNEWVELCNMGDLCEDLSGARIKDASNLEPTVFPAQTIFRPGACKILSNNTPGSTVCNVLTNLQWRVPVTLNNAEGDTITLMDADGNTISEVSYTSDIAEEGFSVERCLDSNGEPVYVQTAADVYGCENSGTPGELNLCSVQQ
ncbi:MAG: lamin tail domain-containing protein [Deltaproteobacteria bacterium]|nr:MAG: lamin tail domain-containing protein [Deltaproteobacteria bacterium]